MYASLYGLEHVHTTASSTPFRVTVKEVSRVSRYPQSYLFLNTFTVSLFAAKESHISVCLCMDGFATSEVCCGCPWVLCVPQALLQAWEWTHGAWVGLVPSAGVTARCPASLTPSSIHLQ